MGFLSPLDYLKYHISYLWIKLEDLNERDLSHEEVWNILRWSWVGFLGWEMRMKYFRKRLVALVKKEKSGKSRVWKSQRKKKIRWRTKKSLISYRRNTKNNNKIFVCFFFFFFNFISFFKMFLILGLILREMEKHLEEHQSPGEEIQILLNSFTPEYTKFHTYTWLISLHHKHDTVNTQIIWWTICLEV